MKLSVFVTPMGKGAVNETNKYNNGVQPEKKVNQMRRSELRRLISF
jgi:TPP-dependent 2-oxoacid decarboxylase